MRLIDADALMEYCNNLKDKTIDANDIARFPAISPWVIAKNRLPAESGDVIVCTDKGHVASVGYSKKYEAFNWYDCLGAPETREKALWEVEYWMPIPPLPEEDDGK